MGHDGLELETDYSYKGRDGTCAADKTKEQVKATSYKDVTPKSGAAMKAALDEGPVSVAIDAAGIMFQLYHGGIMKGGGLFGCGTSLITVSLLSAMVPKVAKTTGSSRT